jgi:hypothetical protein
MQNKFKSPIKKAQIGGMTLPNLGQLPSNLKKAAPRIEQIQREKAMLLPGVTPLPTDFKGVVSMKPANENVQPTYAASQAGAFKEKIEKGDPAFDYYQHYMTKGNGDQMMGAILGNWIKSRRNKKEFNRLNEIDNKNRAEAEQRAKMQSAINKGLNVKRTEDATLVTKQFRDKNDKIKEVIIGDMNKPAIQTAVSKLDDKGNIPGTNVTPANTVGAKANSSSGSNSSGSYTPYSIPGDKTYEYAKDSNGDWVTRKRGDKEGAYVTLLDNKSAIAKLDREAVAGDLYAGYRGSSGKSSGSSGSGSSSKFKSPLNTSAPLPKNWDPNADLKKVRRTGFNEKIDGGSRVDMLNNFTDFTMDQLQNRIKYRENPENNYNSDFDKAYIKRAKEELNRRNKKNVKGIPWNETSNSATDYRGMGTVDPSKYTKAEKEQYSDWAITGATTVAGGPLLKGATKMVVTQIPKVGRAVQVGGQYVDDLGRYVSKKGDVLGKAPKEIAAKTKEFFKKGESIGVQEYGKLFSTKTKDIAPGLTRLPNGRISKLQDTRGGLQKMMENSNLSASFKNTLNSVATTGKRLSKKAYDALSKTEKSTYDSVIANKIKKMQTGGSTFSRENLFNHYYNNM